MGGRRDEKRARQADLGVDDCVFRAGATVFGLKEHPENTPPPVRSKLEGKQEWRREADSKRRPCWALMGGFDSGGMSASVTS